MSRITIPVHVHLVTCRADEISHPHGWDPNQVNGVFTTVNRIWEQARIRFRPGPPSEEAIDLPEGAAVSLLDDAGLVQVARTLRRADGPGISLACVHGFARARRAAVAMEALSTCAVGRLGGRTEPVARALAHELGHCLELHHPERPPEGPRHQAALLAYLGNLMQEGVVRADPALTPEQIARARASRIARHFPPSAAP